MERVLAEKKGNLLNAEEIVKTVYIAGAKYDTINKGKMVENEKTILEIFVKALLSENEKEVVSVLYRISEPLGNFTRRFVVCEKGKNFLLHKDGARELISEEQLKNLLKISDEGRFYSGGIHCHLHPIFFEENKKETLGYLIVDNRMTLEAERAVPYLAALLLKLKELKKGSEKNSHLYLFEKLIKEVEEFSGECGCLEIIRRLSPLLKEIFSLKLLIVGTRKFNSFEAAALRGEDDIFAISVNSDISFLIGKNLEENNGQSSQFYEQFARSFGVKAEKYIVPTVKFLGEKAELFVVVGCDEKPSDKSVEFLDRAATLFLFLRKMQAIEESEKNLAECFNLVAKRLETQSKVFNFIKSGILVLSKDGKIVFNNGRAEELLAITKVEQREKVLLRSKEPGKTLLTLISRVAEEGKSIAAPFNVYGKIIDLDVSEMERGIFLVVSEDSTSLYKEMDEKKHLFSLITHEVKNPLASVLSASEMISSERAGKLENPQQKKLAEIIYRNAKQMREILDDVSLFGKSLYGAGGEKEVSIKGIIEKILEEKKEIIKAKEIVVWKELMEVSMVCNPAMMETLISNLIGNAVKYSSVKGNVGVKAIALANGIRLEVIDDGVGIPKEDLERIGEPFFRAENVRENIAGTGFGLSIVKNIVSRHQGEFRVLSPITEEDRIFIHNFDSAQRGAKFVITFPLVGGENAKQNFDRG